MPRSQRLVLALFAAALGGPASGQAVVLEGASLRAAGPLPYSNFGGDVALLGERLFVGLRDAERVQVFRDSGSGYALEAELTPPDGSPGDRFGFSLAVGGAYCVVGAPWHDRTAADAGAAYVFAFDGTTWGFEQKLLPSSASASDEFGWAVDCIGNRIAVGARKADYPGHADQGSVFVFDRTGAPWSEVAKLTGPDSIGGDQFGIAVALEGPLLVAGAANADAGYPFSGAAYAFRDLGLGPIFEHKFTPPVVGGTFAHQIDISGERVALGMPYGGADGAGVVCVYERVSEVWDAGFVCDVPYGSALDQLGSSVALHGDRLVAGSIFDWIWGDFSGSAVVFEEDGGSWTPQLKLIPSDGQYDGSFGLSVDFDGTRVVVGAPSVSPGINPPPSFERVYVYTQLSERVGTAVCAGDGSVTPCPCGNDSPVGFEMGCENGFNRAANLAASGSASVASDDLFLSVEHLTRVSGVPGAGVYAQLLAGSSLLSGVTFGDGLRCAGGTVQRVGAPQVATTGGLAWWGPGLAFPAGWAPGQTLHFQVFYRDPALGGCGANVNTSNALSVTFTP